MSSNDLLQPPAHFDSSERELWDNIVAHTPPGTLQRCDAGIIQMLVKEPSARRRIEAEMKTADAESVTILKGTPRGIDRADQTMLRRGYDLFRIC